MLKVGRYQPQKIQSSHLKYYHIGDPLDRLFSDSTPVAPQSPMERFHTTSRRPYNEMVAMLVFQTNPVGVELFSYVNTFLLFRRCSLSGEGKQPSHGPLRTGCRNSLPQPFLGPLQILNKRRLGTSQVCLVDSC